MVDSRWVGAGPGDDLEARLAAEDAAEAFDLSRPHVGTLLGPIEPAALGLTVIVRTLLPADHERRGDELVATLAALEDFYAVGGRTVVDLGARGEDREALRWVAARAPVHILAPGLSAQAEGARAGIAAMVDIGEPSAGQRPDLAVGSFGVVDLDQGAASGADRARRAAVVAGLVRDGLGDRLLLATAGPAAATEAGVPVLSDWLERWPLALMAAGLDAPAVRRLLVENPAAALTTAFSPGAAEGA